MATVAEQFNLDHTLHFKSGETTSVGHLVSFEVAGTALSSDLQVVDPTDNRTVRTVGVLEAVDWKGGRTDPIRIQAYVSAQNHQFLSALIDKPLARASAVLNFATYGYDQTTKQYFERFAPTQAPLKSLIDAEGSKPAIEFAHTPVENPPMWAFSVTILPPPNSSQALLFAAKPDARALQSWGVEA